MVSANFSSFSQIREFYWSRAGLAAKFFTGRNIIDPSNKCRKCTVPNVIPSGRNGEDNPVTAKVDGIAGNQPATK